MTFLRCVQDASSTSQKRFFVTSLRRLKDISKKCLFRDVSEMSQKHLTQLFVIFHWYLRQSFGKSTIVKVQW